MFLEEEITPNKSTLPKRAARIDKLLRVEFGNEFRKTIDFIKNISKTGLFISTHHPFPKGEVIDIKFNLPNLNYPIKVRAKVVWSRSFPEGLTKVRGMGVRFLNLAPWDEVALVDFLNNNRKSG
jgi:uncharacterized protein (TIGR02266 family)